MMADIRRSWEQLENGSWGGTSTGAANVYDITPTIPISVTPAVYTAGAFYNFIAHQANTGPATLSVSGLTAAAIQWQGAALIGGEIPNGAVIKCLYDGTQFQLISPAGFTAGDILQRVKGTTTTADINSTTTPQASNLSAIITPKAANSIIEIVASFGHQISSSTNSNIGGLARPYRDTTAIGLSIAQTRQLVAQPRTGTTDLNSFGTSSVITEDAPGVTTPVTYAIWHNGVNAGDTSTITHGEIFLREIKA